MQRTKEEDALMSQIANLETKLREKRHELATYRISQSGIAVGDIVVTDKGRFRVAQVRPWALGVDLKVNALKKDGTFGSRAISLYGKWTKEVDDDAN